MSKSYDLHTHTVASDGTFTSIELLDKAKKNLVKGIAITDHDTVDGLEQAEIYAKKIGLELIPGIELSCYKGDYEIHILGYFVNYKDENFLKELKKLDNLRTERNLKIIEKLLKYNIKINMAELKKEATGSIISKAHIANLMVKKGIVYTRGEAFSQYLGQHGVAYVKKAGSRPEDAIKMLKENGAVVVLAHPKLISTNDRIVEEIIKDLKKSGLDGIEAEYSSFTQEDVIKYRKIALDYDLVVTGGSDFHGGNREGVDIGDSGITIEEFQELKNRKK